MSAPGLSHNIIHTMVRACSKNCIQIGW